MSYRDDLDAAVNRASALDRENAQLKAALEAAKVSKETIAATKKKEPKVKVKCHTCNGPFYRIGGAAFFCGLGIVIALGLATLFYTIITEHGPGNCYVESEGLTFTLMRTIEWGDDREVGKYKTVQEALDDAAKIQCKVE